MSNGAETRIRRSRRKILQAAQAVFLRHGFSGTSMDSLAEVAGVSKQTVYAHFGSKETLFIEMVESATGGAADELKTRVEDPVPDQPLEVFLLAFATEQLSIVLTPELMRLRRLVIGEADRFPELGRALFEKGPGRSINRLTGAFRHYRDSGALVASDPGVAASYFNWLLMGGPTSEAMLLGDASLPSRTWQEAHARECVRIFLCAFQPDAAP